MDERIKKALIMAYENGSEDGGHHKMWVIDQMVKALTGCPMVECTQLDCNGKPYTFKEQGQSDEYKEWIKKFKDGEDGPDTYSWDEGIPP